MIGNFDTTRGKRWFKKKNFSPAKKNKISFLHPIVGTSNEKSRLILTSLKLMKPKIEQIQELFPK